MLNTFLALFTISLINLTPISSSYQHGEIILPAKSHHTPQNKNFVKPTSNIFNQATEDLGPRTQSRVLQSSTYKESLVNSLTQQNQFNPKLAVVNPDIIAFAWERDSGDATLQSEISVQYFNTTSGIQLSSSESQANSYTTADQQNPSIVGLVGGNVVVVWESVGQDSGDTVTPPLSGIYAIITTDVGSVIKTEFQVNTYTTNSQTNPSVNSLEGGGFVIVWSGEGSTDPTGIYAKIFDSSGTVTVPEFRVNDYTNGIQDFPQVLGLNGGGFVVVWSGEGTGDANGIFAKIFDVTGTATGSEFLVNSYTANLQLYPNIDMLVSGEFVICWEGEGAEDADGIYFQMYSSSGTAQGSQTSANSHVTNSQEFCGVAGLLDGSFVISWSGEGVEDDDGVYARAYTSSGVAMFDEFSVNKFIIGTQTNAAIRGHYDGSFFLTWQGPGYGDDYGVYSTRFDSNIFLMKALYPPMGFSILDLSFDLATAQFDSNSQYIMPSTLMGCDVIDNLCTKANTAMYYTVNQQIVPIAATACYMNTGGCTQAGFSIYNKTSQQILPYNYVACDPVLFNCTNNLYLNSGGSIGTINFMGAFWSFMLAAISQIYFGGATAFLSKAAAESLDKINIAQGVISALGRFFFMLMLVPIFGIILGLFKVATKKVMDPWGRLYDKDTGFRTGYMRPKFDIMVVVGQIMWSILSLIILLAKSTSSPMKIWCDFYFPPLMFTLLDLWINTIPPFILRDFLKKKLAKKGEKFVVRLHKVITGVPGFLIVCGITTLMPSLRTKGYADDLIQNFIFLKTNFLVSMILSSTVAATISILASFVANRHNFILVHDSTCSIESQKDLYLQKDVFSTYVKKSNPNNVVTCQMIQNFFDGKPQILNSSCSRIADGWKNNLSNSKKGCWFVTISPEHQNDGGDGPAYGSAMTGLEGFMRKKSKKSSRAGKLYQKSDKTNRTNS